MNKLKKVLLDVKIGDKFECVKKMDFFFKGLSYFVIDVDHDISSGVTTVTFLDDEMDRHPITDAFLAINFEKQ